MLGAAGNGTWPGNAAWSCGNLPTGHVSHGCTGWLVSSAPATTQNGRPLKSCSRRCTSSAVQGAPLLILPGNKGTDHPPATTKLHVPSLTTLITTNFFTCVLPPLGSPSLRRKYGLFVVKVAAKMLPCTACPPQRDLRTHAPALPFCP